MTDRWSKFWWQDYEGDDALRVCSLAAQGLWMRMLCAMHKGTPYGHLTINGRPATVRQIAAIASAPEREVAKLLAELALAGVFSHGKDAAIFCRRMVRDKAEREKFAAFGKTGGNPALKHDDNPPDNHGGNGGGLTPSVNGGLKLQEAEAEAEAEREEKEQPKPSVSPSPLVAARPKSPCGFDDFWAAYPRKVGKDAARRAWKSAMKRATVEEIAAGLNAAVLHWPVDRQFVPHPATWLNAGRWQDRPEDIAPEKPGKLDYLHGFLNGKDSLQ